MTADANDAPQQQALTSSEWPRISLKKLEIVNFGKHKNVVVDFTHHGGVMGLACLVGPNGTGKTTILNAVQNLCSNFSEYDEQRYFSLMCKSVHDVTNMTPVQLLKLREEPHMMLRGTFQIVSGNESGTYTVELNQIRPVSTHPEFVHARIINYCFYARFDMELHMFQLKRSRWPAFKELFSTITGFPVEEDDTIFSMSSDSNFEKSLKEYVMGFRIRKGNDVFTQRQCSSGERKIAKCFSTILNKDIPPSIILIDNATMHVEVGRHISVIESLEKCFPESQIIATCHSVPVAKSLPRRERLMDMRFLDTPQWIRDEPWRLRLIDDVSETVERLRNAGMGQKADEGSAILASLQSAPTCDTVYDDFVKPSCEFLSQAPFLLMEDLHSTPLPKLGRIV